MAKRKERRPNLPEETLARARAELAGTSPVATAPAASQSTTVPNRPTIPQKQIIKTTITDEELRSEYGYVIADLRSMALLAVFLSVAMVVGALIFV